MQVGLTDLNQIVLACKCDDIVFLQLFTPLGFHRSVQQNFSMLYSDLGFKAILDKVGNFQKLAEADGELFDNNRSCGGHSTIW
ncbi:hypothetical protein SAMN02745220_03340 [Desulfopila aestuarii DSM 18488]|uniref:Uncharacterized protein n=1 Tax=Desulfopila aestuarii DSM 18488 TaxID=1121416 RepID=A0A1M7YCD9_9BACT|nr:hypothetical protein SAMN02745220_03340 [Desulfopila aestuarii DSM 18488]